ncbi:MAG: GGDEF domain-containing protein [Lachnospiraceae bacterium]|nr:GGDEF domain-containing protein [Lachnospiraceae bacterium]
MATMFCSNEMKQFFEMIQKPVRTSEELLVNVRLAIAYLEESLEIGKVLLEFSAPKTKLRAQTQNFTGILYERDDVNVANPITHTFGTVDGGQVVITLYSIAGHIWSEEELDILKIISNIIFQAFKVENMNTLLDKAMSTDLSVDIPNINGFMQVVMEKFSRGLLEEYIGVYFNIHNFKYVNNVLPYVKADEVMAMYVNAVKAQVESDEMIARLGGDNFVALIHSKNIDKFFSFIHNVKLIYKDGNEEKKFRFDATIGAAKLNDIRRPGEVMIRISIAYQVARQQESADVIFYRDEYYRDVAKQKEIIAGFHRGLEQQEFVVHYQPKVMCKDRGVYGGEALVRWNVNNQLVYPMEFIPILERDGSVCKLDYFVLGKSCELLAKCKAEGIPLPRISINFSRRHMENPYLVQEIVEIIDKYNVPHEYIEIELTESEDFRDYIVMATLIDELKAEGISTSIDDFGTGYSSLNMLKMTSIDILKIDKSFIPFDSEDSQKDKACIMFESIARLAGELGVMVVAEGVETEQQYEYLTGMGCDIIQGYYFDKPLPEEAFLEKVKMAKY